MNYESINSETRSHLVVAVNITDSVAAFITNGVGKVETEVDRDKRIW